MVTRLLGWLWHRGNRARRYARTMAAGSAASAGAGPLSDGERKASGRTDAPQGSPAKPTAAPLPQAGDDGAGGQR